MGFFSDIIESAIDVAFVPVAIVKDAIDVTQGDKPESTKELLTDAVEKLKDAGENLIEGDL